MPDNNPQQQTRAQQQAARAAEGASRAAERLEQTAEHATGVAIDKVRQAREQAQSGLEQQRAQVADRVRRVGGVLRSGSHTLSLDDPLSQRMFEVAGDRIERIADYIDSVSPSELADDVQSFARRRPGLFFGSTFLIGLALGRFAKSSGASGLEQDALEPSEFEPDEPQRALQSPPTSARAAETSHGAGAPGPASGAGSAQSAKGGSVPAYGTGSAASSSAAGAKTPAMTGASHGSRSGTSAPPAQPLSPSATPRRVDDREGSKS